MTADRWINALVTITLVEMMVAVGLASPLANVMATARQGRLLLRAAIANYLIVPAAAVVLLTLLHAQPMAAAGILILAVCPGAPYGPPFTAIAHGKPAISVGLMVILASTSALVAPLVLSVLLPLTSGDARLRIDAARVVGTLLATQLLPLCAGMGLRAWQPGVAERLLPPANLLSKLLNLSAIALILSTQFRIFLEIRWAALGGMLVLLLLSFVAGWCLGGPSRAERKTMALAASLRNAGVSMVIASGSFPGTPALTAVVGYAIVDVLGSLMVALWWGRRDAMRER